MKSTFRIAAFDSGLGGLSALAPLLRDTRGGRVSYLGDLANLPYGSKSARRIEQLSAANIRHLTDESRFARPDLFVLACNTASAYALDSIGTILSEKGIPFVGVIEPSCREAIRRAPSRVLVLATQGTVSSGSYETQLRKLGFAGEVVSIPCPLFVPFVEEGVTSGPAVQWVIQKYLSAQARPGDLAILGCTHYPFLLESLRREFPRLHFVHAGEALRNEVLVRRVLADAQVAPDAGGGHEIELVFTDNPDVPGRLERFLKLLGMKDGNALSVREIAPVI